MTIFDQQKFMSRLKALRKEKGLSTRDLARAIGVTSGAITQFEKGISSPALNTVIAFSKYLGVSTDYLLGVSDYTNLTPVSRSNLNEPYDLSGEDEISLHALSSYEQCDAAGMKRLINRTLNEGLSDESLRELLTFIDYLRFRQNFREKSQ